MGLSLATARMLLEAHRGRITVASEGQGKGSEFVVALPLAEGQGAQIQAGAKPGRGRLVIHYSTLDQLDGLLCKLR